MAPIKAQHRRVQEAGYVEMDQLGGNDPYSASKVMADLLTQSWTNSFPGAATAIARAGNVVGGGNVNRERLLPDLIAGFALPARGAAVAARTRLPQRLSHPRRRAVGRLRAGRVELRTGARQASSRSARSPHWRPSCGAAGPTGSLPAATIRTRRTSSPSTPPRLNGNWAGATASASAMLWHGRSTGPDEWRRRRPACGDERADRLSRKPRVKSASDSMFRSLSPRRPPPRSTAPRTPLPARSRASWPSRPPA